MSGSRSLKSLSPDSTASSTVSQLLEDFQIARKESDRLFGILKPEFLFHRPIAERHRVIFYLGHLDGFDSIQICRQALGLPSADPELDQLFQAGIDPDSANLPADTVADWPSLQQIKDYAQRCREHVDANLERASQDVVYMALEHRLMHLETLAYMFHNFDPKMKLEVGGQQVVASSLVPEQWCSVPAGLATLGKSNDGEFGWDNEFDQVDRFVEAFRIQRYNVTNGDYLRFVADGAKLPHFWIRQGSAIHVRGMFGTFPLPLDWPVYVSQREAADYAAWSGKSLPTEEQFHRAAYGTPSGHQRPFPWGTSEPSRAYGNFNFHRWDPEAVTATPGGDSAFGVSQLVGNGWEWTKTAFGPLPGFKAHDTYPGYSANFFDGEHFVIKGGSSRTGARLLRRSFRNWFRHDYPYMYSTFRCIES